MKLILDDSELEELKIEDIIATSDKGVVHVPVHNKTENKPDIVKEIAAYDDINFGEGVASKINGISTQSANKYGDGKDIADDETRARVLSTKFGIADIAVTKLMETLNLFKPSEIDKPRELVQAASQLSSIIEKVSGKEGSNQSVHLHMYAPNQKKVKDFDIIDV